MTTILRTKTYLHFKLSDSDKNINDYFRKVEAQYWQLKHYLNYHLENKNVIPSWTEIYEDWQNALKIIKKTNLKIYRAVYMRYAIIC